MSPDRNAPSNGDGTVKILFLTDNFPPETNAPALRTYEHARVWVEEGHEVTVVTGAPNFPTGRIHEGYRNRAYALEQMDGIRVVRVWTYITPNTGHFRRSLDYLSFMLTSIPAAMRQQRPDVVVGTSPQLLTVVSAWVAARFHRAPFVFELRDLWPESMIAVGAAKGGAFMRGIAGIAHGMYRRADRIVSVTESFVEVLRERGVPPEKMTVVRNGVNLTEFAPSGNSGGDGGPAKAFRDEVGVGAGDFLVTYVGTMGMAHGLRSVLAAADATRGEPVHYLFVGEGADKAALASEALRRRLTNVTFLKGQPRKRIPTILNASDAVLVHLRDDPLFSTVIPSKIFEAMAVAKPMILGVRGESAEIVGGAGAGILVEPESPEELSAAVHRLRVDPELARELGENGRRAAENEFCRREAGLKMLSVLEEVAGAD